MPRRIGFHVARLLRRFLERRREQQRQRRLASQQMRSSDSMARAARAGLAAPEITLQDCAMASMRHSSLPAEPSGVPSSKKPRRYQSPSQACCSSAARSVGGVSQPALASAGSLRFSRQRRERVERGVQEPAQPHALAAAVLADAVHAVIPVAGADQRQAVRAHVERALESAPAMFEQAWRSASPSDGSKKAS